MRIIVLVLFTLLTGCSNNTNYKDYSVTILSLDRCTFSTRLKNFDQYYCNIEVRIQDEPFVVKGNVYKHRSLREPYYIRCDLEKEQCIGEIKGE